MNVVVTAVKQGLRAKAEVWVIHIEESFMNTSFPLFLPSFLRPSLHHSLPPFFSVQFARLEYVSLLSSLVKCYPHHARFSDMATHLTHEDKEADFFENICHVQLHRRTKAMRKLACACKEGLLGSHSMTGFLVQFANQVIFHSTSNVEQNLVAESVNVISGMCLHLKWTKYCYLLRHYLRLLTKKSDIQKTLIR